MNTQTQQSSERFVQDLNQSKKQVIQQSNFLRQLKEQTDNTKVMKFLNEAIGNLDLAITHISRAQSKISERINSSKQQQQQNGGEPQYSYKRERETV